MLTLFMSKRRRYNSQARLSRGLTGPTRDPAFRQDFAEKPRTGPLTGRRSTAYLVSGVIVRSLASSHTELNIKRLEQTRYQKRCLTSRSQAILAEGRTHSCIASPFKRKK